MSDNPTTGFNPNYLDELVVTQALANGNHAAILTAYFGDADYLELTQLAQRALTTPINPRAPKLYLLPGLLGSKLGVDTSGQADLLWLEPANVITGRLAELIFGKSSSISPLGVLLPGYLKLALTLRGAGISVKMFCYDWRRSVVDIGHQLANEIARDTADEIQIVAHSMGGLVARAALNHPSSSKITRLIQIGTPNNGSYALVQTLRACYPTVRKLGALDQHHSAEQLIQQIFSGFQSFYEMLPTASHTPNINLFEVECWPQDMLTPSTEQLKAGQLVIPWLAKADHRCHTILGTEQTTVTGIRRGDNGFIFQFSSQGDGTVPTALGYWQDAQHWYIADTHGRLPRNSQVCQAVVDLVNTNTTSLLSTQSTSQVGIISEQTESDLKLLANQKLHWERLPLNERRDLLEPSISDVFTSACSTLN